MITYDLSGVHRWRLYFESAGFQMMNETPTWKVRHIDPSQINLLTITTEEITMANNTVKKTTLEKQINSWSPLMSSKSNL